MNAKNLFLNKKKKIDQILFLLTFNNSPENFYFTLIFYEVAINIPLWCSVKILEIDFFEDIRALLVTTLLISP